MGIANCQGGSNTKEKRVVELSSDDDIELGSIETSDGLNDEESATLDEIVVAALRGTLSRCQRVGFR